MKDWKNIFATVPRFKHIVYLLKVKFPYVPFTAIGEMNSHPGQKLTREITLKVQEYTTELKAKTDQELKELYDKDKKRAEDEFEANLFFNQKGAEAKYDLVVPSEWVSIDKAVALCCGKDPFEVSREKIRKLGIPNHPFVVKYEKLVENALYAFCKFPLSSWGIFPHLTTKVQLIAFVKWALKFNKDWVSPKFLTAIKFDVKKRNEKLSPVEENQSSNEMPIKDAPKKKSGMKMIWCLIIFFTSLVGYKIRDKVSDKISDKVIELAPACMNLVKNFFLI